ncbi:MAG TPA: hypothetical protein VMV45_21410 [Casimicrobiaceae bacterium]|nr:hypothetical protein [Casimicrobiaceae bacterium]
MAAHHRISVPALFVATVLGGFFTAGVAVLFDHVDESAPLTVAARLDTGASTPTEVAIVPGRIEVVGVREKSREQVAARKDSTTCDNARNALVDTHAVKDTAPWIPARDRAFCAAAPGVVATPAS